MGADNTFGETNFNPDMVMENEETKPEMTAGEFVNCVVNLRTSACFMTEGDARELYDEVMGHLRSVIRGELIKKADALAEIFQQNRFDKDHHLGMGDIRLTVAQQDAIIEFLKDNQ